MKKLFKYMGISMILLISFYYTEKMSNIVMNNDKLVKEIRDSSSDYEISPVSAIIDDLYIIPGLNGYAVNVLKSYDNMRFLNTFNSYYLKYDIIKPSISIDNNKDKIIKYGNPKKNSVSIILKDNLEIIDYALEKKVKITRIVTNKTFNKNAPYEQINGDYENFKLLEKALDNININKNICYINDIYIDICKNNNKYLVDSSLILNNYNLSNIKNNIKSGYIIYINDNVSIQDFKLLVRQIYYQDLDIVFLSTLINEERD